MLTHEVSSITDEDLRLAQDASMKGYSAKSVMTVRKVRVTRAIEQKKKSEISSLDASSEESSENISHAETLGKLTGPLTKPLLVLGIVDDIIQEEASIAEEDLTLGE